MGAGRPLAMPDMRQSCSFRDRPLIFPGFDSIDAWQIVEENMQVAYQHGDVLFAQSGEQGVLSRKGQADDPVVNFVTFGGQP